MPGPLFLETERLELRTVEAEDADVIQRARNHPEVRRYISGFREPRSREAVAEDVPADDGVRLLVVPKPDEPAVDDESAVGGEPPVDGEAQDDGEARDGGVVGQASLDYVNDAEGWANLSFWLFPAARGRGYATEAAATLVAFGFRERGLRRITANALAPNEGSVAVLERLGFVHEGTQREKSLADGEYVDVELFGLLRREWPGTDAVLDRD